MKGAVVANPDEDEAVVIVRDITDQKRVEEVIRKNEEKYRLLSEKLEQRVKRANGRDSRSIR